MMAPVNRPQPKTMPITPWGQRDAIFKQLDQDGNGQIGRDEFKRQLRPDAKHGDELFARYDGNKDGNISRGEFDRLRPFLERPQSVFHAMGMALMGIADFAVRAVTNPLNTFNRDLWF